ncbi:MAG: NAD(P)H-binding protein [Pseudomonadota bacterium]
MEGEQQTPRHRKRIMLLGATGTIGRVTARALLDRGHEVICFIRSQSSAGESETPEDVKAHLNGAIIRVGSVLESASLKEHGFCGEQFDVLVSCLASRTGEPKDAWAVDYQAHAHALGVAKDAGARHMVLLSAICVQKPKLAFQQAKLAFEKELIESGLTYSIVRPTAFFKSLSGQVERVKAGKPYLMFGDGELTACKPISDNDLGSYIADCLDDASLHNRVLPIGGPGDAITPKEQGEYLFSLLGLEPKFRKVPPAMLLGIAGVLSVLARLYPPLAAKAEYARIGHYYATESMLVWDEERQKYSADLTPSTGSDTLFTHYKSLMSD